MAEPTAENVEVLVVGGGMAGIFAAIGAAEAGAGVLLIEAHHVLGGQGTAGGVSGFCGGGVREHVFADATASFAACHASSLVQLTNGRFLAVWLAGTREGHPDVAIWAAVRSRGAWSAPSRLAKVDDRAHWNPVLFRDPTGSIHLFFKVGATIEQWETWVMMSADEGATWSVPRELAPGDRGGRGPVKNKPIVLASGAWLAPASLERKGEWRVFVDRTEDHGRSWQAGAPLPLDPSAASGAGVIQPTLWESAPGRVHMLMRSTCGWICRSDSTDDGRTWSAIVPTSLANNNSGIDLARLPDGTLALAFNPVHGSNGPRTPLRLALSMDNGLTWPRYLDLETGPGEYSYPAIIPTAMGMALTYTWRRTRIAFWHGAVEAVPPAAGRSVMA